MKPLPNKTEFIHARVRPEFKKNLLELATVERRSMSAMLEELLDFYAEHHPTKSQPRLQPAPKDRK